MPNKLSVLQNFTPALLRKEPFPHFVIEDALPASLYERLSGDYPSADFIFANVDPRRRENEMRSNVRYEMPGRLVCSNPAFDIGLWRDFVLYHTSQDFLDEVIDKLGDAIALRYPQLIPAMQRKAPDGRPRAGVRGHSDAADRCEMALDCQVGINSAVTGPESAVVPPHLDNRVELFAGLYYLRLPEDQSTGGDLLIYRRKAGIPVSFYEKRYVRDTHIELVQAIPYGRNKFAWLLSGLDAVHGVSVRARTTFPRRLVAILAEVYPTLERLFDERPYRERRSLPDRIKSIARRLSGASGHGAKDRH